MKFYEFLLSFFVFLFFCNGADGQQIRENEIVVIQGEKFIIHQVRTGETIYSIEKKFNIDSLSLAFYNPQIKEGLKVGDIIKIPYTEEADLEEQPVYKKGDPVTFESHVITSRKETPYFIAKRYGITVEELYAYNPEVKRFRKGTRVRIPRWEKPEEIAPKEPELLPKITAEKEKSQLFKHKVTSGETLFSLSRRYNISVSEILFYNPGARNLKAGSIVYLPVDEDYSEEKPVPPELVERETEIFPSTEDKHFSPSAGKFFEHIILSGETLWGISHKYDVPEEELIALNPFLEEEFPAGVTIKIPVKKNEYKEVKPVNEDAFIKHVVKSGETLFRLSTRYNITIPEIKKFNPVLEERNLVAGETIFIPRKPDKEIVSFMKEITKDQDSIQIESSGYKNNYYDIELPKKIPTGCRQFNRQIFTNRVHEVALFLPLFTFANDTLNRETNAPDYYEDSLIQETELDIKDTIIEEEEPEEMFHGFYDDSENFLEFYEGVLLAVNSLEKTGMQIHLNVYDTQRSVDSIRQYIYDEKFLHTDLIIGPVYPELQREVAAIAAKNRIPMVSPLAANLTLLRSNKHFYQVNPTRDFLGYKTAELIAEEYFNSNFIIFKIGKSENKEMTKITDRVREKLFSSGYWGQPNGFTYNVYDFEEEGPFGFSRILSHEKENVIFIPSFNEGDLSIALSNIDNHSDDYSITLIGFNWYQKFNSIDIEYFHDLKLHYIAPYWVDFNDPATIRFFQKFKENFYTEPDNFGMQGYDVAFYFLSAIRQFGLDFNECLPYLDVRLIQGDYRFEKVTRFGGYMNQGVSLISYQRDYDIVRKRIMGQYKYVTSTSE